MDTTFSAKRLLPWMVSFVLIHFCLVTIRGDKIRICKSRAPNDGFLLNAWKNTFQAIQSTFRFLEMYSKRCYKILISSVIKGLTGVFLKLQGRYSTVRFSLTFFMQFKVSRKRELFRFLSSSHFTNRKFDFLFLLK